jgi:acyl-CoA thioester hydrolase
VSDAQTPTFRWPIRVYYEDTDAAGIVYYANFLKFFERCRTEWLRALGIEQQRLKENEGLQFVVVDASIEYRRPARLDDELSISARIAEAARTYVVFEQQAMRADELLAVARVKVASVDAEKLTPTRLPAQFVNRIQAESPPR